MAKYYAPVAPLPILKYLKARGMLGNYLLLLAHDVAQNIDGYNELLEDMSMFVILDNSTVEQGKPRTDTFGLAKSIAANVACLPDYVGERARTLGAILEFLHNIGYQDFRNTRWMAIPQGEDLDELMRCAYDICELIGGVPDYWGVPRWVANKLGTRAHLVRGLHAINSGTRTNIHLLGMSEHFDDDITCCRMPGVIGIDSANPLVLGQLGKELITQYQHAARKQEGWDYWYDTIPTEQTLHNIVKMRSLIGA
jgi:hypothetical protein